MKKGILIKGDVLLVKDGATTGKTGYYLSDIKAAVNEHVFILRANDRIKPYFLYRTMRSTTFQDKLKPYVKGIIGGVSLEIQRITVPLPPLEIQEEIVAEIESYQKVIDGARAIVENYRPRIPIDPAWSMVSLESVCDIKSGGTPSRNIDKYWNGHVPWVGSSVCKNSFVIKAEEFITEEGLNNSAAKVFPKNTTIVALVGATIGKTGLLTFECAVNQNIAGLQSNSYAILDPLFLFYSVQLLYPEFLKLGEGKFRMANLSFIRSLKIHIPPIETQKKIVEEIEAEQSIVNSNRDLIKRFENKIENAINRVWSELCKNLIKHK